MVDNTIALQVRPFQMPDIGQIYGNAQNIQLNRMRMAEAQEAAQERNALRSLLSSGVDPYSAEGLAQVRRAAPMLAAPFEQAAGQRAYQQAQVRRYNTQADADRFKLYRGQLGGVNSQDAWTNWRNSVVQEFPQFAASIPERFSPQTRLEVAGGADLLIQRATAEAAAARSRAPVSVAPGSSLVDPQTGRVVFTAPARPQDQAPISVAPGNSVIDRAGNVLFTAPARPQDQAPISVAPGNSVIDRAGNVLFTAPERAPSPVSVAPGGTLVNPRTGEPVFTAPERAPSPVSVAPGGTLVNPRTGEPVFTAPDRPQAPSAREQRITDTMATFGVDRPTAVGLVDNIISVVPGSAGEPPVLVNKLTNEIVTPRMGAARPAAAPTGPTAPEAPAIDLRRPQAAAPAAPTNMMLSGATGAPAPVSAPATDSVEDFYAGRRQRQVQQAGQTAEAEARGRVAAPPAPRQDFRYTPDFQGVEPIPGSVAAREAADREKAARVRRETEQQTGGTVIRAINDAEKTIRTAVLPTTGFFAERLSGMGGTAARNLRADLETIRSNIGFDQLNQMRQASPTGGALGNVSNQEIAYLQAVMGSVDQSQSEAQLRRNLSRLRDAYLEIVNYGLGNRPPVEIPGPGGRGTAEPPRDGMPGARQPPAAAPGEIRLPSGVTIRPIQ